MLLAGFGFGALVGYALAGVLVLPARARAVALLAMLVVQSAVLGGLGFVHRPWLALVLMVAVGALNGFFNIILTTAFQVGADESMRGRVMGVVMTVAMGIALVGMALGGVLGDLTGKNLPLIYGASGGLIGLATLLLGSRRPVREFLAFPAAPGSETTPAGD